jgi:hypothetical protein
MADTRYFPDKGGALPSPIKIGLKVFNAILDDAFQLEMLRAINEKCSVRTFQIFWFTPIDCSTPIANSTA